ncbi:hypothetical protein [Candidimonas sp. SYP-B2681]|uniref:hypothetical protein n=1 Tax=Candidimonas sp. SYP-B2681 TaxID=2497686 RepID=UPI0018F71660
MNDMPLPASDELDDEVDLDVKTQEPRFWQDDGWTARVIKNEDDDGWAVEMIKDGEDEPALVGPWTMGRDKKNPKPLDTSAFYTLVKTATEVLMRHEQQLHALLHKSVKVSSPAGRLTIKLDIVPDDDNPSAVLSAWDVQGEQIAQVDISPNFRLNVDSAAAWVADNFKKPAR